MELTVSQKYQQVVGSAEQLESSPLRKDSAEFQREARAVEASLTDLKKQIQQLALFSDNEDLDELQTREIRFLNVDFHLARFYEANATSVEDRMVKLKLAKNLYLQFLHNLENYQVLSKAQLSKLDNFANSFNPTLSELRPDDPVRRREEKIANHRAEQELVAKLKMLDDPTTNLDNLDDEVVRAVYVDQLRLNAVRSFANIESIVMELELLKNFPQRKIQEVREDDEREKPSEKNDYMYTDKLETLTTPLLSKTGKILRPFTILPDRNSVKERVFGTGQVLPSMTVDEFLQQELENGGMVKSRSAEEDKELDEENEAEMDAETYKQREWDEFKEANAKGSGNTTNRG